MEEKELICVECSSTAELVHNGSNEPLCEWCAKDRALEQVEDDGDFYRIENMEDEEIDNLIKEQEDNKK